MLNHLDFTFLSRLSGKIYFIIMGTLVISLQNPRPLLINNQ